MSSSPAATIARVERLRGAHGDRQRMVTAGAGHVGRSPLVLDGERGAQLVVVEQLGEDLPALAAGQLGERRDDGIGAQVRRPVVEGPGEVVEVGLGIGGGALDLVVDLAGQLQVLGAAVGRSRLLHVRPSPSATH